MPWHRGNKARGFPGDALADVLRATLLDGTLRGHAPAALHPVPRTGQRIHPPILSTPGPQYSIIPAILGPLRAAWHPSAPLLVIAPQKLAPALQRTAPAARVSLFSPHTLPCTHVRSLTEVLCP